MDEDKLYEQWKEMNCEFVKRYISELIMQGNLTFDFFKSDCADYFTMTIRMDGQYLNEYES